MNPAAFSLWDAGPLMVVLAAVVFACVLAGLLARAAWLLPRRLDPDLSAQPDSRHRRRRAGLLVVSPLFAVACVWAFAPGLAVVAAIVFVLVLLALAWIDAEAGLLPDLLTLPLLWLGLLVNLNGVFIPLQDAVLGAVAGYLLLWCVYWGFLLYTGREGMGQGDLKLLAALGAWLGWAVLPWVLLISASLGLAIALSLRLTGRMKPGEALSFGPCLAVAGILVLFIMPAKI